VELTDVQGSGPSGRVVVRDVQRQERARTSLREVVLANIEASWQQIPHIHIAAELDGAGLREAQRTAARSPRARVTVTDLLVVAVARALGEVPELNGLLGRPSARINLALAVSTSNGVVAPVLHDADKLSLDEITQERARLVAAAREGRSGPRDLGGATFTLSNLGVYPVDFFAPVISGPQIATLATGRLADKPVLVDGSLAVRPCLWANIAIDHRGADGEAGGRFLAALERQIRELPTVV
jgi:pyruvate dehydrogenase E2 component (dihydrolipoamide acetyltransferase)